MDTRVSRLDCPHCPMGHIFSCVERVAQAGDLTELTVVSGTRIGSAFGSCFGIPGGSGSPVAEAAAAAKFSGATSGRHFARTGGAASDD